MLNLEKKKKKKKKKINRPQKRIRLKEKYKEEYRETISKSNIEDFDYEKSILKIQHLNGKMYEYIGVPRNTFIKMVNADSPSRFARRHIYNEFLYRSASKIVAE